MDQSLGLFGQPHALEVQVGLPHSRLLAQQMVVPLPQHHRQTIVLPIDDVRPLQLLDPIFIFVAFASLLDCPGLQIHKNVLIVEGNRQVSLACMDVLDALHLL